MSPRQPGHAPVTAFTGTEIRVCCYSDASPSRLLLSSMCVCVFEPLRKGSQFQLVPDGRWPVAQTPRQAVPGSSPQPLPVSVSAQAQVAQPGPAPQLPSGLSREGLREPAAALTCFCWPWLGSSPSCSLMGSCGPEAGPLASFPAPPRDGERQIERGRPWLGGTGGSRHSCLGREGRAHTAVCLWALACL